jgi:hypothetical protein
MRHLVELHNVNKLKRTFLRYFRGFSESDARGSENILTHCMRYSMVPQKFLQHSRFLSVFNQVYGDFNATEKVASKKQDVRYFLINLG